ncbi:MAG: prepilin peptidase [Oligoflexia bacterium]|nr:prepilin peptidase [Oligoflexia bacterium]
MISLELVYYFLVGLLGACLGSFANVVIVRLPQGKSISFPWSHCPKCKKTLKPYDNIPLVSYLALRGKCRHCHKSISWKYFAVELLMTILFLMVYHHFGLTVTAIEYFVFSFMAVCCAFIDLDHRILPDKFTLTGIGLGLLGSLVNPERQFIDAVLGLLAGGGFLWAVAYLYLAIRSEEGMGGGDIKLLAWIGALLGWKSIIFCILASSIAGALVGGVYAAIRKSGLRTTIPFGPFLIAAALIYIFAGEQIIAGYLSFFFPFNE